MVKQSLYGDLWSGGMERDNYERISPPNTGCRRPNTSYAQVVSSYSSGEQGPSKKSSRPCISEVVPVDNIHDRHWTVVSYNRRKSPNETRMEGDSKADRLIGNKRPRSPPNRCGRCFRTAHRTVDCRH